MVRAILTLLLMALGSSALVYGMDILRQLEAALGVGSGLAGALRVLVVSISPSTRAQVDGYRWQAEMLIIGGGFLIICGILIGCRRGAKSGKPAKSAKPAGTKRTRARAESD